MLLFLPLLAFLFLATGFHRKRQGWRESLLLASIPWSLFLALLTEALSQFHHLTRIGVDLGWLGFALLCLLWSAKILRLPQPEPGPAAADQNPPLAWEDRAALVAVAVIVGLIALTALASAPNNWDAMEYHLPRVVEWMTNRGVQFYPTPDRHQLYMPPIAEYTMLHLDLLYGSDRLVALVQWFSYLGFIAGCSLLARELGGGRRAQLLAAVLSATVPSALLAASSTKNDCVLTYWIVLAVYLLLRWKQRQGWLGAVAIGGTMGLAMFTKGTAYAFLPCMVLAAALMWSNAARRRFLLQLPVVVAVAVLVCLPLWVRNYQSAGSILGTPYFDGGGTVFARTYRNAHITPAQIAANVARNVSLNVGVPSAHINAFSTRAFSRFISMLGVDPNDPGQISAREWGQTLRFKVGFYPRDEFFSEDPLHVLLFLLAGVLFLAYRKRFGPDPGWYALGVVGSFILYSALLRWAPSNERYLLAVVILGTVFSAVVLDRILPRPAVTAILFLVLLAAIPFVLTNEARPLLTRHGLRGSVLTTPPRPDIFLRRTSRDGRLLPRRRARRPGLPLPLGRGRCRPPAF